MRKQIPDGPSDLVCPFHNKYMAKTCKTCPLWVQLRGVNPNSGEPVDKWDCSFAILPMLLIEASQQARQGAAATESFRNEVVRRADANQNIGYAQPTHLIGHEH